MGGDLVTGEAVVVDLRLAKLPSRAIAVLLDVAVQIGLLIGGVWLLGQVVADADEDAGSVAVLLLVIAVLVGYPLMFETLTRGRSLGKLAMGLRVVRDDGAAVRFRHSLVRALVGVIEIWLTFGVVAILTSLVSTKGQRVGDHLAGTVVVRERVPTTALVTVQMPPQLASWAATLDLSQVTDELALAVRQFLARAPGLTSEARYSMGNRLAAEVAQVVTPSPPTGWPAEPYLAAVLAERRRRDTVRYAPSTSTPYVAAPPPPPAPAPAAAPAPGPSGAEPGGFAPPA